MIEVTVRDGAVVFLVRIVPRSSRDSIDGEFQGALKAHVTAPPVDGRANDALCCILADRLNVPVSAVKILSGEKSRMKRVEVRGVTPAQVQALAQAVAASRKEKRAHGRPQSDSN
ncbi:MAG: DUF167 domain-containing protein [Candidatus Acidiferrales bacterium]